MAASVVRVAVNPLPWVIGADMSWNMNETVVRSTRPGGPVYGVFTLDDLALWRERGRGIARSALKRGDFLLWASGNHLGILPVYDELTEKDCVLQFDAHLDIHHFSDCTEEDAP